MDDSKFMTYAFDLCLRIFIFYYNIRGESLGEQLTQIIF